MLLQEEVNDLQPNADKCFKFGGTPLISRRHLHSSKWSRHKKWQSLMHSGRIVKLLLDRFKYSTLVNHMRSIARNSYDKLHSLSRSCHTFVDRMEFSLTFWFGNNRPPSIVIHDNFGIMIILLDNQRIPRASTCKLWRPVRFRNENGNSSIEVPTKTSDEIFSISPNIWD